ncbi:MAG: SMP-30/gluconolactonase/LRE family protein [Bacteroidetes bacterium]|nr:MAG: SMP-30/gluconolactonase/LRE family protein [Bacteroidota bacterium]
MKHSQTTSAVFLAVLAAVTLFLCPACAIHPLAWHPAPKPAFTGTLTLNDSLKTLEKIPLGAWCGPEDIVFDAQGNLYCGVHRDASDFSDGRILKIDPSGKVEEFFSTNSWVAGLHFDRNGNLIALSHRLGLISISPDKVLTVLADHDEKGRPFLIPNGLDIASDGKIYFSNTSHTSAYTPKYGRKLILEMQPNGGLYRYDPATGAVKTLIEGTYFGNGVVLSQDESHLLMTETERYRVLRYWLRGDKTGGTEVFMDNLPGFPNGISIREDGSYWLGFSTRRNDALDKIHPRPGMKKLVYSLPDFLQPQADLFGMVLHVSPAGDVLGGLFDPTGTSAPEAGAVKEYGGYLYIGGDVMPYVRRVKVR